MRDSFYTQYTDELRQMIMDNPDLPIVVEAETEWMDEKQYQEWRLAEYGRQAGEIRKANLMRYDEAEQKNSRRKR